MWYRDGHWVQGKFTASESVESVFGTTENRRLELTGENVLDALYCVKFLCVDIKI